MVVQLSFFVLIIVIIWLVYVSLSLRKLRANYITLTQGGSKKNLDDVLSTLVSDIAMTKKDIAYLMARCDKIEKDEKYHIQKIGLLRFNPFKDTGGDQSFILALVDAFDTGVVITALYSRSGTRWYSKRVARGKGTELELSEEERKA
ncbi:MAG: DUF4446 family protein, partial [Candidatus Levybacteria bacterium]|nr:DUF4446 family protein [Candidatus Levybacteria bacterium]